MKVLYPYCVSIDWLQLYTKIIDPQKFNEERHSQFIIKKKDVPTTNYLHLATVYYFDPKKDNAKTTFATITYTPRNSTLPANASHVKVENEQLYTSDILQKLQEFYTAYNLQYVSITRLDVCYDCNRFRGGIRPITIINNFFKQKILKVGVASGYLNFKNFGYKIPTGSQKLSKDFTLRIPEINAITWGCKSSGNETQLYNKSLELRTKKYKPWIIDAWETCGLNMSEDVWRLEFRLQNRGKEMQALESGDLFSLGINEIADQHRIEELFMSFAAKQFRFVKADYHVKKSEMKPLQLLSLRTDNEVVIKPHIHTNTVSSTRTIKVLENVLAELEKGIKLQTIQTNDIDIEYKIKSVRTFIHSLRNTNFVSKNNYTSVQVYRLIDAMYLNRNLYLPGEVIQELYENKKLLN